MSGSYSRPVIRLDFTEQLGYGPDDPVWVVIRNPKILPPKMLRVSKQAQAAAEALQDDPASEDAQDEGMAATHGMAGRLVVAWRVYAVPPDPEIDPLTGEFAEVKPELLPQPSGGSGVSAELFGALPAMIQMAVLKEITEAINPPRAPDGPIQKISSGRPSPSSTAPGEAGQPPRS
jgi:hypothetical protein